MDFSQSESRPSTLAMTDPQPGPTSVDCDLDWSSCSSSPCDQRRSESHLRDGRDRERDSVAREIERASVFSSCTSRDSLLVMSTEDWLRISVPGNVPLYRDSEFDLVDLGDEEEEEKANVKTVNQRQTREVSGGHSEISEMEDTALRAKRFRLFERDFAASTDALTRPLALAHSLTTPQIPNARSASPSARSCGYVLLTF